MTALWIAILGLCFLVGAALVLSELHDARREMEHLPVDIDRYTKSARARAKGEDGQVRHGR